MPFAFPSIVTDPQVPLASTWPWNVSVPSHPGSPPRSPVTSNRAAVARGIFVSPGVMENVPVGSVAVPPHVQTVPGGGGPGCAASAGDDQPAIPIAAAAVTTAPITRNLV